MKNMKFLATATKTAISYGIIVVGSVVVIEFGFWAYDKTKKVIIPKSKKEVKKIKETLRALKETRNIDVVE